MNLARGTVIQVDLANEQSKHDIDAELMCRAVQTVLDGEGIRHGIVSLAVVDDPTMQTLNRKYLAHDYATDVLSFRLSDSGEPLEGEVIVSADTASTRSADFSWQMLDELLLYVIHGTLHLAGFDDQAPADRRVMREKEETYLRVLGRKTAAAERISADGERALHGGSSP